MKYGIDTWVTVCTVLDDRDKEYEGMRGKVVKHIMVDGKPLHVMGFENSIEHGSFWFEELIQS